MRLELVAVENEDLAETMGDFIDGIRSLRRYSELSLPKPDRTPATTFVADIISRWIVFNALRSFSGEEALEVWKC